MDHKTKYEKANELIELLRGETDPDIRELRRRAIDRYYQLDAVADLQTGIERLNMGDTYNVGQAGAVGPNSKVEAEEFNQAQEAAPPNIDTQKLASELSALIQALRERTDQAGDSIVIAKVEEAQAAAKEGDVSKALTALSGAGENAVNKAEEIGANTAATALRRSFKIATDLERAHINPWTQLGHREFLVETERIDGLTPSRIWTNLERYGICLIRLLSYPPEQTVLEEVVKLIGFPAEDQNDFSGPIKDINPAVEGRANSGDTTSELGFHVDGTQDPHQPALLAFQYVRGAKLGANSRFADAAGILRGFDDNLRHEILTTLARSDAATFSKLDMRHTGPIFSFSETDALMCRIRFDSVISVHEECHKAFELLKERFEDKQNESMFLPNEGDIVVFDNWRIMHARDEIYGPVQRHHRRVWIAVPRHEHQMTYQLGIRPVPIEIAAKIKGANAS